jgi:type IV pilus assembly protein PilA
MKKHTPLKSKFNAAFSLVELLVVIAVIAVIAAIAIPNITGARDAAVAAQEDYNEASVLRFINTVNAAGATLDGAAATDANYNTGTFSVEVGGETIEFTFED